MVEKIRAGRAKRQHKNFFFWLLFVVFLIRFGFSAFASWDYNYTGGVQSWTAPSSSLYKLEVWGAQGGSSGADGGLGGYSQGQIWLNQGTTLYIVVGGQGTASSDISYYDTKGGTTSKIDISEKAGGYNGGGNGGAGCYRKYKNLWKYFVPGAGGGGATHIATTDRGELKNYANSQNEIVIVAGGGGGAGGWQSGGTGGGTEGESRTRDTNSAAGGTQSYGYAFGQGQTGGGQIYTDNAGEDNGEGRGGGGGGWYGGNAGSNTTANYSNLGGAGGSGHIGSGISNGSMSNGQQSGNGFARITCLHTHNLNTTHWDNAGQRIDNGYAQHQIHRWYSCDANDDYSQEGDYYWENCYDADNNGYCDICGRHRRWVNINVNTPDGDEDASGNTARFNMSWHDNTALGEQQNHWEGQVSDQKNGNVWVGTTIWIDNINISQSSLYLTGVTGATQSGDKYYYEVQDEEHTININTDYKSYSLTINPNGGILNVTDGSIKKNSNGTATATVKYNQTQHCNLGVTASRTHYIMDGFYTSASGGTRLWDNGGTCYAGNGYWNSSKKWCYAGNVTVYAHWSDAPGYHNGVPIVYTITYTLYPKTGTGNIDIAFKPNVKLETTYTIATKTFEVPSLEDTSGNYSFEGWYGSCSSGSKNVTIKQGSIGDLHFEADWLPTKNSSKSDGHDQNLPYVKTTEIKENKVKIAA